MGMEEQSRVREIMVMLEKSSPPIKGKLVAIDADSGDYFIGDDIDDAMNKARIKYPLKALHLRRVGGAVYFIGGFGWKPNT